MGYSFERQKEVLQLLILFKKTLDNFNCKPNKIWVDEGSELYSRSVKLFLQNNNIKM